jgi:hypothetical protein
MYAQLPLAASLAYSQAAAIVCLNTAGAPAAATAAVARLGQRGGAPAAAPGIDSGASEDEDEAAAEESDKNEDEEDEEGEEEEDAEADVNPAAGFEFEEDEDEDEEEDEEEDEDEDGMYGYGEKPGCCQCSGCTAACYFCHHAVITALLKAGSRAWRRPHLICSSSPALDALIAAPAATATPAV